MSFFALSQACHQHLYRVRCLSSHAPTAAFVLADDRSAAQRKFSAAYCALYDLPSRFLHLYQLESYRELVALGVSRDEELRIFEIVWKDAIALSWVRTPLFLSNDSSLLHKWAELQELTAGGIMTGALQKARLQTGH